MMIIVDNYILRHRRKQNNYKNYLFQDFSINNLKLNELYIHIENTKQENYTFLTAVLSIL
jgi:hypothetical protein